VIYSVRRLASTTYHTRNCIGHEGTMLTPGEGAVSKTQDTKPKVTTNTRSLTESVLITADMFMPEMLWSLYFRKVKGTQWNV